MVKRKEQNDGALEDKIRMNSYVLALKLYCGYKYTRPCMINRI